MIPEAFSGQHYPDPELEAGVAARLAEQCGQLIVAALETLGFAELDGQMDRHLYREVTPTLKEALGLATSIGQSMSRVARMERELEEAKASILEERKQ